MTVDIIVCVKCNKFAIIKENGTRTKFFIGDLNSLCTNVKTAITSVTCAECKHYEDVRKLAVSNN